MMSETARTWITLLAIVISMIALGRSCAHAQPVTYDETTTVLLRQVISCERVAVGLQQRVTQLEAENAALKAKPTEAPTNGGPNPEK